MERLVKVVVALQILIAIIMIPTLSTAQELVTNGSFETGDTTGWTVVNVVGAVWETRTGGQAGTYYSNAENPLAGGGTYVAYGNTGGEGLSVIYQDVNIPAAATSALLSADVGYQSQGGTAASFMIIDVLDTLGLPATIGYTGGTIYTQYYFHTNAAGDDPMAARAALDLLGVAGIAAGATVRIRLIVSHGLSSLGATADRISVLIPQGTAPPPPGGPIEGPPKGGADDLFGACGGGDEWMPLGLGGQVTPAPPGGLLLNRLMPAPYVGAPQGAEMVLAIAESGVPGLIIRLTSPSGEEVEYFIGLGESGTLPNGVEYFSELLICLEVRSLNLILNWPAEVLAGMEPGLWTITYTTIDSNGLISNIRWEYLDVGISPTWAKAGVSTRNTGELAFALAVNQFSLDDYELHPVSNGTCQVIQEGAVLDTFRIENGQLNAVVPYGQTSRLYFNWPETNENISLRAEFEDGFVKVLDENRNDKEVEVFQVPGTDRYAFEYYRNRIYICNQGDEGGPLLGQLYGPWAD